MNVLDDPKYSHLLKRQPFYLRIGKTLLYNWAKFIFSWYTPIKIFGKENIPNSSFIYCSNHNAHLDVIALSIAANKNFNDIGMLAAKDYWFENSFRRNIMKPVMNLIPLGRKSASQNDITFDETTILSDKFMKIDKRCIIIFPEGTRSENAKILPFKKGGLVLAINLNMPVVPVGIIGSNSLVKDKFSSSKNSLKLIFGKPIETKNLTYDDRNVFAFNLRKEVVRLVRS